MSNIALLVEKKVGIAIGTQSANLQYKTNEAVFIPFSEKQKSHSLLAWKKNRFLSPAVSHFIEHTKKQNLS